MAQVVKVYFSRPLCDADRPTNSNIVLGGATNVHFALHSLCWIEYVGGNSTLHYIVGRANTLSVVRIPQTGTKRE